MTNEELHTKLEIVKTELDKAHKEGNIDRIDYYVKELNELWEEAGKEMLKNAEEGGWYTPK